jgi:hypothetical protein
VDEYLPIHLVADFATLVGTYAKGFAIIIEPYDDRLPSVPDPVIQVSHMSSAAHSSMLFCCTACHPLICCPASCLGVRLFRAVA